MKKYAVKIPFDHESSDMLYVTEGDSKFHLRIKAFDTVEEAREEAEAWGPGAVIVELHNHHELLL